MCVSEREVKVCLQVAKENNSERVGGKCWPRASEVRVCWAHKMKRTKNRPRAL